MRLPPSVQTANGVSIARADFLPKMAPPSASSPPAGRFRSSLVASCPIYRIRACSGGSGQTIGGLTSGKIGFGLPAHPVATSTADSTRMTRRVVRILKLPPHAELEELKALVLVRVVELRVAEQCIDLRLAMPPAQLELLLEPRRPSAQAVVLVAVQHGQAPREARRESVLQLCGEREQVELVGRLEIGDRGVRGVEREERVVVDALRVAREEPVGLEGVDRAVVVLVLGAERDVPEPVLDAVRRVGELVQHEGAGVVGIDVLIGFGIARVECQPLERAFLEVVAKPGTER